MALRILVWDEDPPHAPKEIYPKSIRGAVAEGLQALDTRGKLEVKVASLSDPGQGASEASLAETDVLFWWGHMFHGKVDDAVAERIARRVRQGGMGFICLHSGHYSKPFKKVIEGKGDLKGGWRESNDSETIRVCAPWHPVAAGVSDFVLPNEEMYGAPFDVPPYETLILQSHFSEGGETFPSGICWTFGDGIDPEFTSGPGGGVGQGHGIGRVFYFRPGHESYPTYYDKNVRLVLFNAALWAGKLT